MTLALGAAGAASSLMAPGPPKPPPLPEPGAMSPDGVRKSNAIVRVGIGDKEESDADAPEYEGFVERRTTGTALGGLGRGGLGL